MERTSRLGVVGLHSECWLGLAGLAGVDGVMKPEANTNAKLLLSVVWGGSAGVREIGGRGK